MTPPAPAGTPAAADAVAALGRALGGAASTAHGSTTVDVDAARWVEAAAAARDAGFGFFDFLTAVDVGGAGPAAPAELQVVLSLWSVERRARLLLRCLVTGAPPHLASLAGLWPGAAWAERETAEMFGLVVDGHPSLGPLLLPEGFSGHPLRKDFVLAARAARPWPGVVQPGTASRRAPVPPGVPGPGAFPEPAGAFPQPAGAGPASDGPTGGSRDP